MLISILVPEGLAVAAVVQWREATVLQAAWRSEMRLPELKWTARLRFWATDKTEGFGMEGAFFVVMGGFVVDLDPDLSNGWTRTTEGDSPLTTLTSDGFLKYLAQGYIHSDTFRMEDIYEKHTSSAISKFLACIQAAWFTLQCGSRWVAGLPLSLLEIHVAIQVLFTAVMYVFWWQKPLDVGTPIKIVLRMKDGYGVSSDRSLPVIPQYTSSELNFAQEKTDDELLVLGSEAQSFFTRPTTSTTGDLDLLSIASHDLAKHIMKPLIGQGGMESKFLPFAMAVEIGLVIGSGMLHAAAWHSRFPSVVEGWIWRVASLTICILAPLIGYLTYKNHYHEDLIMLLWKLQLREYSSGAWYSTWFSTIDSTSDRHAKRLTNRGLMGKKWVHMNIMCVILIMVGVYSGAVLFLTLESYLCLRYLPEAAFQTPRWVNYWPIA